MNYEKAQQALQARPRTWLVTGAAGFIGSNLVEKLLLLNQRVVGLDDLSTGYQKNLDDIKDVVGGSRWKNFEFIKGDIRKPAVCESACAAKIEYLLHQAALGSVPRSIKDPVTTNNVNVGGTLNILAAAEAAGIRRVVYASSSAVYGDSPELPKLEGREGNLLSPYAASKAANELYATVYSELYDLETVGLRYFNVFGRRQDPDGAYAAVIPRWVSMMKNGETCEIYGDGETSRDFCYIDNVVQANLMAALAPADRIKGRVFNIACGDRTTLNDLFGAIAERVSARVDGAPKFKPSYLQFREGDVRHSLADINAARTGFKYEPTHDLTQGLDETIDWYLAQD